jgi:hypothetical protein
MGNNKSNSSSSTANTGKTTDQLLLKSKRLEEEADALFPSLTGNTQTGGVFLPQLEVLFAIKPIG